MDARYSIICTICCNCKLFVPTHLKNGEELGIRVSSSFFLFSTPNQVPQTVNGMGHVIYHNKVFSVVIRTTLKGLIKLSQSREKQD